MLKEKLIPIPDEGEEFIEPEYDEIKFNDFISQIFDEIDVEDKEDELTRYRKWAKNRAFYRGQQRGFWDSKKRAWINIDIDTLSPSEASVLVVNNQFRPQVKTLAKEFSRSQVRIRVSPISDSQRASLASRFSDSLVKFYQAKLLKETDRQREAKFLFLCGNSFRYSHYDKDANSPKVKVKKSGKVNLPAYESSKCTQCGYETQDDTCPECGSPVEKISIAGETREGITGYEFIKSGEPVTEIVDPVEIKVWAGATDIANTPYLRRKRIVKPEFIHQAYPFYKLKENIKMSDSAQYQWQFFDNSKKQDVTNNTRGLIEYDQLWLDTFRYHNKKLEEEAKFWIKIKGKWVEKTLPAGTVLSDEFNEGLYVARVGKDILCVYNENKLDFWEHIPYDLNVDGFWADGLEDSVMNQQIINEYTSLSVENVLYNASPKLIINPELINPATVTGRPKDMLLMSNNARSDKEPKQAVHQISGMSLTQEVMLGIDNAKRDMREQTGALVGFNGQGDPVIGTATGMSIARDSALALVSTTLAIRAEKDVAWMWQILKIVKKYWYDEKYKFLLGKYSDEEAKAFKESDLDTEIQLNVEGNSWMPTTNFEKLQNLGAFLTAFGLPFGFLNPEVPDVVKDYAVRLYDIPFDMDELAPDKRIAQKRLDRGKEIAALQIPVAIKNAQMLGMAGKHEEGTTLLQGTIKIISDAMGVEEDIDDHKVFIVFYTKWLKTDEGQNANEILRSAVKATIADHKMWLEINTGMDSVAGAIVPPPQNASGQQSAPTFQPTENAESPFMPNNKGVQDFSLNAKK